MNDTGIAKKWYKSCPRDTVSNTNPTHTGQGLKLSLREKNPVKFMSQEFSTFPISSGLISKTTYLYPNSKDPVRTCLNVLKTQPTLFIN